MFSRNGYFHKTLDLFPSFKYCLEVVQKLLEERKREQL